MRILQQHVIVTEEDGSSIVGSLVVRDDGVVEFRAGLDPQQPSEAVKGRLGEFEEVETPVQ